MAYHKKIYGLGFDILGKYDGWHYGIWTSCFPKSFVFLKEINDNDFVFCCIDTFCSKDKNIIIPNLFNGKLTLTWMKCIDDHFNESNENEVQTLLDTKLNRYAEYPDVNVGDYIYVLEEYKVEKSYKRVEVSEKSYQKDGVYLKYYCDFICCVVSIAIDKYGVSWFTEEPQ